VKEFVIQKTNHFRFRRNFFAFPPFHEILNDREDKGEAHLKAYTDILYRQFSGAVGILHLFVKKARHKSS